MDSLVISAENCNVTSKTQHLTAVVGTVGLHSAYSTSNCTADRITQYYIPAGWIIRAIKTSSSQLSEQQSKGSVNTHTCTEKMICNVGQMLSRALTGPVTSRIQLFPPSDKNTDAVTDNGAVLTAFICLAQTRWSEGRHKKIATANPLGQKNRKCVSLAPAPPFALTQWPVSRQKAAPPPPSPTLCLFVLTSHLFSSLSPPICTLPFHFFSITF